MSKYFPRPQIFRAGLLMLGALLPCAAALAATPPSAGDVFANNGNYAAAVQAFVAAHQQAPKDAAIVASLARANLRLGKNKQAVDWATQAVALAPKSAAYQILLGDAYGAYVNDVGMFSKLGIAHKIRDAYQQAVAVEPDNAKAHMQLAMFYLIAPGVAGGSDSKGETQMQWLAKSNPGMVDTARANKAMNDEKYAEAVDWLRKASAIATDAHADVTLGGFLAYRKQPVEALAALQQATARYPSAPDAWYQIGKLAAEGHADPQAGIQALNTYLGLPIDWRTGSAPFCGAHYRLAQIYGRLGDTARARQEYQQAVRLNPDFKEAKQALQKLGPA